ncbi:vWA domain-containing protein [Brevibacterium otitidis]|uniref:VWA domain-containing protein n=1 Tax=Brevibacterium otitidis TaxID=53364 RepID=A0ABV5X239_9MICO|nr:VWA domain-containing protein [Brevibacterium otitidis]
MSFAPIMPWPLLAVLAVLLIGGCITLAVFISRRRIAWILRAAAVGLLITAFLRPGVPTQVTTLVPVAAADVFLLVDTTASVVAEDWDGDKPRLEGIRSDVDALLEQLPGARVSVITFDSRSTVRVPLTTDHAAVRSALEVMRPERTTASTGSTVTAARETLGDRLTKSEEDRPDNQRFVFYFGDGEQTSEEQPESLADIGQRIDGGGVFGYGTDAGGRMLETAGFDWWITDPSDEPEEEEEPGYIQDPETGKDALSIIDEEQLKTIASDLGVDYAHRTAGTDLQTAVTMPELQEQHNAESVADGREDFFWIPLLGVLVILAIDAGRSLAQFRALNRLYALLRRSQ